MTKQFMHTYNKRILQENVNASVFFDKVVKHLRPTVSVFAKKETSQITQTNEQFPRINISRFRGLKEMLKDKRGEKDSIKQIF